MKHNVSGKQLNRDTSARRALFKNLMLSLIEHGSIKTTQAKAKSIQGSFEKLITKAKAGTLNDPRQIDTVLNQRKAVNRLVDEIAPKLNRTSGFTRITKLENRRGDDAKIVRLEILDWQPKVVEPVKKETKAAKVETKEAPKTAKATPALVEDKASAAKVKRPAAATTQAKHIPQKRISGGK